MTGADPEGHPEPADWDTLRADLAELQADRAWLIARLNELDDRVEDLAGGLDAIEAAASAPIPAPPEGAPDADDARPSPRPPSEPSELDSDEAGLDMRVLVPWVRDHVASLLERKIPQNQGRLRWCRSWWMHPEAIARFDALRRSWIEAITADEGNALVVYYEHLDRQLSSLMDEQGPFGACAGGEHRPDRQLGRLGQCDPPPAYFTELDQFRQL